MFGLIPKEENFFELFEKAALNAHEGAKLLVELMEPGADRAALAKKVKDIEHQGDQLTHDTIERLNKTFITPMDREDIHELVCRVDDVLDFIDTATSKMVLYKVADATPDSRALAQCLKHATLLITEAMPLLRDMKNAKAILEKSIAIHTQENEADRILHHALAALFEGNLDAKEIIKWKDVYEDLEASTDRCEDVANVFEGIVLKNA
jgi:uncharacterized protein Yka (UPF0111/DUF47 family)